MIKHIFISQASGFVNGIGLLVIVGNGYYAMLELDSYPSNESYRVAFTLLLMVCLYIGKLK